MRKFLFLFTAVLAYLVLSSRSCEGPEQEDAAAEEAPLAETREHIFNEFGSEDLSIASLQAFEVKAKQKLIDLGDYLHIYTVKSMDDSFKEQARQMILELFISDSVLIDPLLTDGPEGKYLILPEFIASVPVSGYHSIDFIFDSIEIANPLRRTDENSYTGTLTFSRYVKFCTTSDTAITGPATLEVEMTASKVNKAFGADTLQIWSVFLGNIH